MDCPNRDRFCFICGLFAPPKNRRDLTKHTIAGFEGYFLTAYNPYLWYTPNVVCDYCRRGLEGWNEKQEVDQRHTMK